MRPAQPKSFSCVVCHRRKVKCDRQEPCSNCAKSRVGCVYQAPPPPRRRKRDRDADTDAHHEEERSVRETPRHTPVAADREKHTSLAKHSTSSAGELRGGSGKMILKEGNSFYVDTTLWTSLPDAAEIFSDGADDNSDIVSQGGDDASFLLAGPQKETSLVGLHPDPLRIFKLWQTFLERVNPLTKVVHVPTIQQQILDAMSDLEKVNKEFEALMFSVYCAALTSLRPEEVDKAFGETKKSLLSRCRRGAQQAFRNASFLRSSSTVVLQAYMLFLLSMRSFSDPHTIWTLSGIALRMAQRMGIHRDGSNHGLSIFETEMRRRIWLQLVILEGTSAEFCGVAAAPFVNADTQLPMNVNDSDLDPRMTEPACEKEGPTEMIFCLARSEFGGWLRRWRSDASGSGSPWAFLTSTEMSLSEKDRSIDELEAVMERKFLRYCDPSIPLHSVTTLMIRSVCHYTRLLAHHPRHHRDSSTRISQPEKNLVYENCLRMIEYADYGQTNPDVQQFTWHMANHMPWDAIVIVLSEMRQRDDLCEKNRVWEIIGSIYGRYVRYRWKNSETALHRALQRLFIKSWRGYTDDCRRNGCPPRACPTVIRNMLDNVDSTIESNAQHGNSGLDASEALEQQVQQPPESLLGLGAENAECLLGDSPLDWNEWDRLLDECQDPLGEDMTMMTRSV
ncbi:hypothetical protein PDE_01679 [Penicillium oxalicum 114-2]|uniref:Zn(2)-C6 fungal-type domain-containing protein n=2 Tax=Penicillium oxalicum TaxID=69781 RepID=S7Z827_PENO1|nr:hypothetical protein PDE_01679 [Penicillium oxalicum 114-2]